MENKIMTQEEIKCVIRKKYVKAYIHCKLDCEMTCAGNGVNACEALNVYKDLAIQFDISIKEPTDEEYKELENNSYYQDLMEQFNIISLRH